MTTHPEIRPDKNGNFVTRHIKNFVDGKKNAAATPVMSAAPPKPPVIGELVQCPFCMVEYNRGTHHTCAVRHLVQVTPAGKKVLAACIRSGGRPLIVGGTVRDAILNRIKGNKAYEPKDLDVEVYNVEDLDVLLAELSKIGVVNQTGVSFGVIKVRVNYEEFDVSLPRRDSKVGDGHRGFIVEVDSKLDEVAAFARRDFTLNAMGYDYATSKLVDPYGGAQDLADGILRHTSDAFSEDPLRVLRGIQFAARFGFEMAPETIEESARIKDSFGEIAVERVWGEFDKILTKGIKPSAAIELLEATGWMEHFPELGRMREVPQDPVWHPEGDVLTHLAMAADEAATIARKRKLKEHDKRIVVLAAMVHDLGKFGKGTQINYNEDGTLKNVTSLGHPEYGVPYIKEFAKRIGAPRSLVEPVVKLTETHMSHIAVGDAIPSSRAVRNLVRRLGDGEDGASLRNWAILVDSDQMGRGVEGGGTGRGWLWFQKALDMKSVVPQKNLVDGAMLKNIGLQPGVIYKDIIEASKVAQDDEVFTDKESAEKWARNHIAGLGLSPVIPRIDPRR